MTRTAERALMPVRPEEGSSTGADRPATLIQRSSSERSLGNTQEAGALGISVPYLISPRRLDPIKAKKVLSFASLFEKSGILSLFGYSTLWS